MSLRLVQKSPLEPSNIAFNGASSRKTLMTGWPVSYEIPVSAVECNVQRRLKLEDLTTEWPLSSEVPVRAVEKTTDSPSSSVVPVRAVEKTLTTEHSPCPEAFVHR